MMLRISIIGDRNEIHDLKPSGVRIDEGAQLCKIYDTSGTRSEFVAAYNVDRIASIEWTEMVE